ncbi:MAG: hypothetical protein ABIW84_00355 [Ilumatobacteraceae bacterium]
MTFIMPMDILGAPTFGYFGNAADGTITETSNTTRDFLRCDSYTVNSGVTITPTTTPGGIFIIAKTRITINGTLDCKGKGNAANTGGFGKTGSLPTGGVAGGVYYLASHAMMTLDAKDKVLDNQVGAGGATGETGTSSVVGLGGGGAGAYVGGGSGSNGGTSAGAAGAAGAGGTGGGFIILIAPSIIISSTAVVRVDGNVGGNSTSNSGAGGGGAGGFIMLIAGSVGIDSAATFTALGGNGGKSDNYTGGNGGAAFKGGINSTAGSGTGGGAGGGGAGGIIMQKKVLPPT